MRKFRYHFTDQELKDSVEVKEDVFFEKNGLKHKQFYKGQFIPKRVYELFFNKKKTKTAESKAKKEEIKQEKVEVDAVKVETKSKPKTKSKPTKKRKKRAKSILKK